MSTAPAEQLERASVVAFRLAGSKPGVGAASFDATGRMVGGVVVDADADLREAVIQWLDHDGEVSSEAPLLNGRADREP